MVPDIKWIPQDRLPWDRWGDLSSQYRFAAKNCWRKFPITAGFYKDIFHTKISKHLQDRWLLVEKMALQPFNNQLILQAESEVDLRLICRNNIKNKNRKGSIFKPLCWTRQRESKQMDGKETGNSCCIKESILFYKMKTVCSGTNLSSCSINFSLET